MRKPKGVLVFIISFILVPVLAASYVAYRPDTVYSILGKPHGTVAQRDAGSTPATGDTYYITDGASTSDCTIGGGSSKVSCIYNGAAWVADGGAGFTITLPSTHVETVKMADCQAPSQGEFNTHMNAEYPNPPYDGSAIKTGSDWKLANMNYWQCTTTTTVPGSTTTTTSTSTTSTSSTSTTSTSSTSTTSTSSTSTTSTSSTSSTSTSSTSSTSTSSTSTTTTTSSTTTTTTSTTTTTLAPLANFSDFPWVSAFVAAETGSTDCGGGTCDNGESVTQWSDTETQAAHLTNTIHTSYPTYDENNCPNTTPAIVFSGGTDEYLENTTLNCEDGTNNRCTVIIIGKWTGTPDTNDTIFADEGGDNRAEIVSNGTIWRHYAGDTFRNEASVDTSFHVIRWDLDGGASGSGTTPWQLDNNSATSQDAGPNSVAGGITIGANFAGTGGNAAFEYCAIGLYEGDATADADWNKLQKYVCTTWSLGMNCVCGGGSPTCPQ